MEQLLRYIIEEPPEDAESRQAFKYAVATEIFFDGFIVLTFSKNFDANEEHVKFLLFQYHVCNLSI